MSSLQEESSSLKDAFATLEVACTKLKNTRLFLKLLEAVLKTGNRMNDGTYRGGAQAFKLHTLLKLSDVKGTDGKTTLPSFVVQEIIRSEGIKAARATRRGWSLSSVNTRIFKKNRVKNLPEYYWKLGLEVVSQLSKELEDVKKAALVDGDNITFNSFEVRKHVQENKDLINNELNTAGEATEFCTALNSYLERAEAEITWMLEEDKRIMALVKSAGDYFHGSSGKDEGLRLFVVVCDFLKLLDNICNDVRKTAVKNSRKKDDLAEKAEPSSKENRQHSSPNVCNKLFPADKGRLMDYSSSEEESMSS